MMFNAAQCNAGGEKCKWRYELYQGHFLSPNRPKDVLWSDQILHQELPMKIVILDGYTINPGDNPWDPVAAQGELIVYDRTPPELKVERAIDADILLTSKAKLDAATIAALPRLKYIS